MHEHAPTDRLSRFLRAGQACLAVNFRGLDSVVELLAEVHAHGQPVAIDRQIWDHLDFRRLAPDRLAQLAFGIVRVADIAPAAPRESVAIVEPAGVAAEPLALLRGLGICHLAIDASHAAAESVVEHALAVANEGEWQSIVLIAPALHSAPDWRPPTALGERSVRIDGLLRRSQDPHEPVDVQALRRPFAGGTDPLEAPLARSGLRRVHRSLWWRRDRVAVPLWADRWLLPDARRIGLGPGSLSREGDALARAPTTADAWRRAARSGSRAWTSLRRGDWLGVALLDALWREEPVPCHRFRELGGEAWQQVCTALARQSNLPAGLPPSLLEGVPALSREDRLRINAELIATDACV
jgi:hypothetical protein